MVGAMSDWSDELGSWLKPFLDRLRSVQPMAERLAPGEYDQLHHFVSAGVWEATPLETELLIQADRLVGGSDAVLVIHDTAVPKPALGRRGSAIRFSPGQDRQLPDAGVADACARRSASDDGPAPFPSRELDE